MNESVLGDRYRVEARIGAGGMAEVFRGLDPVLNRTVAIKVLLPQFARDAGFVARFRREAQAAARLNHPNIVGVFDTGADGDTQYIVMEFIEGRTLADVLASGKRPTPMQSVELAQKVGQALAAAHAQGIVHRDIKPANVMVTREGTVKVMDFGIARIESVETAPQTSSVLGTPTYLSPEQAQGLPVDLRSDIYSLGVLLYELLAGRPPFTGDSPVAIAYKQVNEAAVPPSQVNPDVAPRLDAVVMKALAKNPANRYQTAAEMVEDLERVRKGQEVQATPLLPAAMGDATQVIARPQATQALPPSEEPQGSGRKVWLGVLIGILVVAVLAGAGYLLANALKGEDTPGAFKLDDVTGMLYPDAKDLLEGKGLVVTKEAKESNKPEDTVLKQTPQADALVRAGETVTLTVATARTIGIVPDLTGMTTSEASLALAEEGLTLGTQTPAPSDDYEPGQIISQSIFPDTEVPIDTPIDVTIASGPASITLTDVTCQPYGAAKAELKKYGLEAVFGGSTAPILPQCPNKNNVALQDPAAGTPVPLGGTVTLYTGAETSPTPTASPTPTP